MKVIHESIYRSDSSKRFGGIDYIKITLGGAVIACLIGPIIDMINSHYTGWRYRAMLFSCVLYFIAGSLLILKINKK